MAFDPVDWRTAFAIDVPILELIARGTVMYLAVFVVVRITGRRAAGELAIRDFIFVMLLAVGAQNAMLGDHASIGSGLVLVLTLGAWNLGVDVLSYRVRLVERLVAPAPIVVIKEGQLLRANMRREYLTEDELLTHLRESGYDDPSTIKRAYVESDGAISVIPRD